MANCQPVPLNKVKISDLFWSKYVELVRNTVIPYQWEALNDRVPDAEPSHAVTNLRIAAGLEEGEFRGFVFQDSDVAKWIEAVGYSLQSHPDSELEAAVDSIIDIIEKAQQPDGYLNTHFTIKQPDKRWTNLHECHELYVAGHMIEAAVAYHEATGKKKLLDIMCRFADYIDTVFGPEPEKIHGYDGHQEIELALVKLYRATGNERYLKLSKYFIDERGKEPNFFNIEWEKRGRYSFWTNTVSKKPDLKYCQAHKPVREQKSAVGHAVRAVYMYAGMADIAAETGDNELMDACRVLWDNIVSKQMYITGGIGSTHHGEAFTFDYDLPNDTIYAETCASIGLIFFANRMLNIEQKSIYADVMERALYNNVLGAMSLDGKRFFYVNPLEVWPEASEKNPGRFHVKPVRQKWFACACCPPNVARLLTSLNNYIYSKNNNTVYIHLYISGEAEIELENGKLILNQCSRYPWDGNVKIGVVLESISPVSIALRIPSWCRKWSVYVNGEEVNPELVNGYAFVKRVWRENDEIELKMDMPAEFIWSNPNVRANAGKVAIQRGPIVYCIEEADNGRNLSAIEIDTTSGLTIETDKAVLGEGVIIKGKGLRTIDDGWQNDLYKPCEISKKEVEIKAVPYFVWGNREPGEMTVWIRSLN
ncbi:MAG: glycoside hydrolase family 127 protein [Bacillota bacterium]|jgi:DUF1680 family protein|nr:glycoside hydrolase family 127 protein [Bacillota bacterium]NLV63237.1 glycoside hydrolase family 127 protein [Clostridiaceae bacterium]